MGNRLTPYKCFLLPIGSDIMDFKEKIIILLVKALITSIISISVVLAIFIYSYFWSDYSYIDNTNTNTNINTPVEGGEY